MRENRYTILVADFRISCVIKLYKTSITLFLFLYYTIGGSLLCSFFDIM